VATSAGVELQTRARSSRRGVSPVEGRTVPGPDEVGLEGGFVKPWLRNSLIVFSAAVAVLAGGARADEIPLVSGEHWTKATVEQKKAYLIGIANIVQIETAYAGATPAGDAQSVVPRMARGLKGQTLDSVREALDRWYAANPQRLQRPVIETIWFEMVVPGLKTQ
jgi:hypothetical protein